MDPLLDPNAGTIHDLAGLLDRPDVIVTRIIIAPGPANPLLEQPRAESMRARHRVRRMRRASRRRAPMFSHPLNPVTPLGRKGWLR